MGTAAFTQNTEVRIAGKGFLMLRKVTDDTWQLEETKTKRIHEKTDIELRSMYVDGILEFACAEELTNCKSKLTGKSNLEISEALMNDAKVRRAYALAANECPATKAAIEAVAKEVWVKLGKPAEVPHWTTVYRWKKRLIDAGRDIHAVVAKVSKKGNRKRKYPPEVIKIIEDAIESCYMTPEKHPMQAVLDKAVLNVRRENKLRPEQLQLKEPTRRVVTSMISDVPAFDRCLAREGRTVAARRFRAVLGHRTTEAPLERAEIDHTLLDLMVIDDDSGLPLGRPVLTACIDDYTRCVLGINIGFEPASFLTVARCLKSVFMPKTNLKTLYPEIQNAWDAHGVMRELSMDNGLEFHSNSLEEACYSLGIEIHYSARKTPWFKGKIERFQGTLNRAVTHTAPGTTFSNILEKGDYDPLKHAVVRLSALQQIVRKWIVDVYHQQPHRALKVPPAAMWKSSINIEDILVPEDPEKLDAILGRRAERVLTHKGIEFEGLSYNSPDLTKLRMQLGEKLDVEICVDDGDIGKIVVLSPDKKQMFAVPAIAQAYANGLTAWQHKVCKRYAANQLAKYDTTAWLEAKERIAEMIRDEFALKKAKGKTRSRGARYKTGANVALDSTAGSACDDVDIKTKSPPALPLPAQPSTLKHPLATSPTSAPVSASSLSTLQPRLIPVIRQRNQYQTQPEN